MAFGQGAAADPMAGGAGMPPGLAAAMAMPKRKGRGRKRGGMRKRGGKMRMRGRKR